MATTRGQGWHWPVALLLALLLHGLAALWILTNTEIQPASSAAGNGVVISLASAQLAVAGAKPGSHNSAKTANEAPAALSPPKQHEPPVPADAGVAADFAPVAAEMMTKPAAVENTALPLVAPEAAPAVLPDAPMVSPTEAPIAKTYAIPADELRAMQAAERRRKQAREREQTQQARQLEQQSRRIAEVNRQRAVARQKTAQQTRPRPPTPAIQTGQSSANQARESVVANTLTRAEPGQANGAIDSGSAAAPNQGENSVSTPVGSTSGSSEIPDCRDDSDIGGDRNKAEYKHTLRRYLQARQKYPRRAAQRRQQGCVVAQISIDQQGRVTAASLIRQSGHRLLDSAALKLVTPGKKLPTPPAALANLSFKIPFDYRLN